MLYENKDFDSVRLVEYKLLREAVRRTNTHHQQQNFY